MEKVADTDLATYISMYPHNTDCTDKFNLLISLAYRKDKTGKTLEEFIDMCLYMYGGTIAGAMIDYLSNHE